MSVLHDRYAMANRAYRASLEQLADRHRTLDGSKSTTRLRYDDSQEVAPYARLIGKTLAREMLLYRRAPYPSDFTAGNDDDVDKDDDDDDEDI